MDVLTPTTIAALHRPTGPTGRLMPQRQAPGWPTLAEPYAWSANLRDHDARRQAPPDLAGREADHLSTTATVDIPAGTSVHVGRDTAEE